MVIGRRKSVAQAGVAVSRPTEALQAGLASLHACRYKEAARELRHAAEADPESAAIRGYLAAALFQLKEYSSALAEADCAIALAPRDGVVHLLRGRALDELGRTVDAAEACRAAVRCNPENKDAHLSLSAIALKLGDMRTAEVSLENAAVIDPYDHDVLLDLATVRERRGNLCGAIEAMQWSISLNARRPDEYLRLSHLLDLSGDLDGAIEAMRTAWELTPGEPSNLFVLARLLLRQRKFGEVLALYEKAIMRAGGKKDRFTSDLAEHSSSFLLAEQELRMNETALPLGLAKPALSIVRGEAPRSAVDGDLPSAPMRDPDSIDFLEDSVSADPMNSRLRRELSIRYLQAGRLIEARSEAEMAERLTARRGAAV